MNYWQTRDRVTEGTQIPRSPSSCRCLACKTLYISHAVECITQYFAGYRIPREQGHGIETLVDAVDLRKRSENPLMQQARSHWRQRPVQNRQKRSVGISTTQRLHQLEVSSRHFIERHCTAGSLDYRTSEVWNSSRL